MLWWWCERWSAWLWLWWVYIIIWILNWQHLHSIWCRLLLFNDDGELQIRAYDKWDDNNFDIVNYPLMDSNNPIGPPYGVNVSQLIAFARICTDFHDFWKIHKWFVSKLLKQGFSSIKLKKVLSSFKIDIKMLS